MKLLKRQEYYMLEVHHNESLQSAFIWFLFHRNKECRNFCPLCKYYYRCQEDVSLRLSLED